MVEKLLVHYGVKNICFQILTWITTGRVPILHYKQDPPTPICSSHYPPLDPTFIALTEPRVRSHSGRHPWWGKHLGVVFMPYFKNFLCSTSYESITCSHFFFFKKLHQNYIVSIKKIRKHKLIYTQCLSKSCLYWFWKLTNQLRHFI